MKFSRRSFLQGVSASVASCWAWGNQAFLAPDQINAYGSILGQSNVKKIALLVGINRYAQGTTLAGCETDVILQQELLVHRFGFQPQDIVTLIDENATRDNIINAFNTHLQQATKDDVVIFHFSGYGRNIITELSDTADNVAPSLITYDNKESEQKQVNDILLDTLIKLAENLNTQKYVLVIDAGCTSASSSIQQQIALRSYNYNAEITISQAELDLNKQISKNSTSSFKIDPNQTKISGMLLSPMLKNVALEIRSVAFNSGLFTYTLTQSLWTTLNRNSNAHLQKQIETKISLYTHQPTAIDFLPLKSTNNINYYLPFVTSSQGVGVISKRVEPNNVEIQLLGLPLLLLLNYGVNSLLSANLEGENVKIRIDSLSGNKAKGTVITNNFSLVKSGLILQEAVRVISNKLGLKIGLNNNLNKIEKVDATSALSSINIVSSISNIGTTFVDYILDKSTETNHKGYALYSPTGIPLEYTNPTSEHEGIYNAVKRLEEFKYLEFDLAYKLLNLTNNQYSSALNLTSQLQINSNNSISQFTKYTPNSNSIQNAESEQELIKIPQNSSINLQLSNHDSDNLYYLVFEINPSQEILIYTNPQCKYIKPEETKLLPSNGDSFKWFINGNKGLGELIIICAKSPFRRTVEVLNKTNGSKLQNEQVFLVKESVNVVRAMLRDLHNGSELNSNNDFYHLDVNHWTTFNFVYQVV